MDKATLGKRARPIHSVDKAILDEETRARFTHRRWHPIWAGSPFEKYARVITRRNLWRVRQYLHGEFEDGVQECAFVFARCVKYYDNSEVDNPAWFMAIYKTSLHNHWVNLSTKDTRLREGEAEAAYDQMLFQAGHSYNEGPLAVSWSECSDEVKRAALLIANAPAELLTWILKPNSSAAAIDKRIRAAFKLRPGTTVMTELAKIIIQ